MPVLIDVLANDHDPDGDPLQIMALTMPGHGTVAVVTPETVRYAPQEDFTGIDYFSYTISDGRKGQSTASVEVRVQGVNSAPSAVDNRVTTSRDQPITFDVLANDSDADGDPLTITGFSLPAHGQLAYHADQTFTYTPGPGFVGEDGFGYTISDGRGGTAQAEVTLVVEWPNQAPVALDDRATTTQGVPVTIDILANDSDPDGDPLTLVALTMPFHGHLAVNADQSITYTPNAGFIGVDDFTYTIDDGRGGRSSAVVVIEVVEAASQAPTAILLDRLEIEAGVAGAVVGLVTVEDPDPGDSHELTVDEPRFEIVDGTLKLEDGVALDSVAEPSVTLAITATDAGGLSLTQSFTISIVVVGKPPARSGALLTSAGDRLVASNGNTLTYEEAA